MVIIRCYVSSKKERGERGEGRAGEEGEVEGRECEEDGYPFPL